VAKVLIAEDEAINRMYISSLLTKRNLESDQFSTGTDAIHALEAGEYDLLLLDMGLPDMDGLELVSRIRRAGMALPIIAVTGRDYPEDVEAMNAAGINGIVAKPIQEYVFYAELTRILGS
jgi:CheY-like chemotaxis protein